MTRTNSSNVQEFDFAWIMHYLGINNKEIIKQYRIWNLEQMDSDENDEKNVWQTHPIKVYANKNFRGMHAAHYIPGANIIEIKEKIDEENPSYWQKTLVAHEFAHALIGKKKIIGNRRGHGVNYYQYLIRDVIWYATKISLAEKFQALKDEFSYSCSLGQYRGTNRIFRSQSCHISLDLSYFSINSLYEDKRSDINNLGKWLWEQISEYIAGLDNKKELLELPISELIDKAKQKVGNETIEITEVQQIKMLRR